jgi:hypothetical protein
MLGTRTAMVHSKLPPFSDNFVLCAFLAAANAIVGAKKVASNVASKLFCSVNVVGQC